MVAHHLAQPDKGSGIAMICTFGDTTDVTWWRELDLPTRAVVQRDGRFQQAQPEWITSGPWDELAGKSAKQAQRRIVELQSRREFESYGALPNDLVNLYQQALQHFLAANPHVEGVWTWTQDGGPWRAGPMTLELTSGLWQLYELNTVLGVRLARDPGADPAEITEETHQ